ncbi:MAG: HlyD family secretion protein [Desulfocucumaceae bacterium]
MPVLILMVLAAAGSYFGYTRFYAAGAGGLQVSGTIEATEVNLTARVPGILESVTVKAGDEVKKEQIVSRLIRKDLAAQRERDALGVDKAAAQLSDLASGAREQELADARSTVNSAQANYEKADSDYSRARQLNQEGALSQTDFEKTEVNLKITKNQLDSAKARLGILESGSRPDQIKAAAIELERSKTVLRATESLLDDTLIPSPIDGTVLTRNFEPGEFVTTGAPVVTVADLKDLWIKVYISTDDLPRIKLGEKVSFTVSGVSEEFSGIITEIASKGEFTPKMIQTRQERTNIVYAVKVKIDNSNGVFKPGMPADVVISQ